MKRAKGEEEEEEEVEQVCASTGNWDCGRVFHSPQCSPHVETEVVEEVKRHESQV